MSVKNTVCVTKRVEIRIDSSAKTRGRFIDGCLRDLPQTIHNTTSAAISFLTWAILIAASDRSWSEEQARIRSVNTQVYKTKHYIDFPFWQTNQFRFWITLLKSIPFRGATRWTPPTFFVRDQTFSVIDLRTFCCTESKLTGCSKRLSGSMSLYACFRRVLHQASNFAFAPDCHLEDVVTYSFFSRSKLRSRLVISFPDRFPRSGCPSP